MMDSCTTPSRQAALGNRHGLTMTPDKENTQELWTYTPEARSQTRKMNSSPNTFTNASRILAFVTDPVSNRDSHYRSTSPTKIYCGVENDPSTPSLTPLMQVRSRSRLSVCSSPGQTPSPHRQIPFSEIHTFASNLNPDTCTDELEANVLVSTPTKCSCDSDHLQNIDFESPPSSPLRTGPIEYVSPNLSNIKMRHHEAKHSLGVIHLQKLRRKIESSRLKRARLVFRQIADQGC
mmetsp:Transcript_15173/g.20943  ORF Transcript_15173/g.20943 Transcript_15173/m.20943 type:complete len:235 (-) Transcript_15173:65-769(-)